jgi:hypothetical protein
MTRDDLLVVLSTLALAQRGGAAKLREAGELARDPRSQATHEGQAQGLEIAAQSIEDLVARERIS